MNLLDLFRNKSNVEERSRDQFTYGSFSITSFFGDGSLVSEEQAMKIPSVATSVELITSSVAQLPVYLYKEKENGEVERIEDRRVSLLNHEPNELVNGHNFKKQMVKDYLFHGASYTKVERVRNDVIALYHLPIQDISITKYKQFGYKHTAVVNLAWDSGNKNHEFSPDELVIVLKDSDDGVTATGVLKNNSETFRLALDEQDYTTGILRHGALPIGILKATSRLTQNAIDRLRSSWENLYGGAKKAGKTIILEEGLDYQPISMKPNEMDLTNSRKNTVSEISRIFNVPESMINSSANKYASNEQNNIHFLQYCISPILTAVESALDKTLLLESEKEAGYYFRFDTSEILRTTEKEKIETAVTAMKAGLLSINEARAKVDMKAIDVDYFTWGLGSVFYNPETGDMTIPNMGVTIDPDNPTPPPGPNSMSNSKDDKSKEDLEESKEDDKDEDQSKDKEKSKEA
ncbi:phage portal protein [Bacillus wiedmannii]|uniref:phage portal protein n=1 Tax=Bacillus wiedmannii TaxID=1890302 RepID=UPI000BFCCB5F|nr:phage portal protein [Bacillus wiedmannii]PHA62868.1 phage portal protein [Bacillus wiedmannii]